MPLRPSALPTLDVPHLAVHGLWCTWLAALLVSWDTLPMTGRVTLMGAGFLLLFWNYAVLHNHMHQPIARPRALRWLVSRTLGVACGFAYRGYHIHHFNHHRYNDGEGDWGRRRSGEGALRYLVRSTLTPWFWPHGLLANVWKVAGQRKGQRAELVLDFVLLQGSLVALALWRPWLALSYFGMMLAGQLSIHVLNLAAHHETDATRRDSLAVTSTSRLYNLLCFNAGYHQAHHLRPQLPWRELPALTERLASEGLIRPALQTPLSPIHPSWVARLLKRYAAAPCAPQKDSTTTSETPSAAI
ncbi:fatty acid desaturase family protein [Archangium violaceum]|uniref:Fatty acid desaturase n=1 Tax=Archangium violaceum Cb vi76 TaxID=1406225 RepID=A0A084SRC7_9BACT|nr:fatty acid desaturase [Archangium violaceum]KFA91012.1 fatty acid desaturase [Archangium violaceum Cb vi76]